MNDSQSIDQIVAAIAALSAPEQRQLLRRLRVSGLLPVEEIVVDRNRLATAPAVRKGPASAPPDAARPANAPRQRNAAPPKATEPRDAAALVPLRMAGQAAPSGSRPPTGKVVLWPGQQQQIVQLTFGQGVTNNEAEYDTLIAALEAVSSKLRDAHADLSTARLDIRGDSLLVVNQVLGEWKCSDERMRGRRDRVRARLRDFGDWKLTHHDRENSVRVLGH